MKKLLLTIAIFATTASAGIQTAAAQQNENQMSIRVAGYEVLLDGKDGTKHDWKNGFRHSHHYGGRIGSFEIGFNGLRDAGGAYDLYPAEERGFMDLRMGRSMHFTFNMWTFSTALTRNHTLGVTMGVGFTANNYTFETPDRYGKRDGMLYPLGDGDGLKKSKLNTFAIHVPLAIEVNPTHNFFFSAGGYVDLVTGAHMKWKSPKEKLRGLSPNFLQAGVTARIGFKNAYAFGSYNFVEIFKQGRGPAFNPYTIGIGFGF